MSFTKAQTAQDLVHYHVGRQ